MPAMKPNPAHDLAVIAFAEYNNAGPRDRIGKTHDGKPVPPFANVGAVVRHKWISTSSACARAGADVVLRLIDAGMSVEQARAKLAELYPVVPWSEDGAQPEPASPSTPEPAPRRTIGPDGVIAPGSSAQPASPSTGGKGEG